MASLKKKFEIWRRKQMIARIRQDFLFFGYDISDFSDEEIKQGLNRLVTIIAHSGISVEEAANAFKLISSLK